MTGPAPVEPIIIELWIPGHPRTKGSHQPQQVKNAAGRRTGRVRLVETKESEDWMKVLINKMKHSAIEQWPVEGEIGCRETYWTPDHPLHPHSGDIEKHVRQTHDAMSKAGVWKDDVQCTLLIVEKRHAAGTPHGPGVQLQAWIRRAY